VDIKNVVSQIVKYDPDRPGYGMSIYNSVIYDAFSDREASKRNYMFFKNGAMPNIILTMDDDLENEDEINAAIDQFELKYRGTDNSH
jgi:capsid portal protein